MDWKDIERSWSACRKHLQRAWPDLTEADLDNVAGDRGMVVRLLHRRYGLTLINAEVALDAWLERLSGELRPPAPSEGEWEGMGQAKYTPRSNS
jgi:hypothetical protein